MFLTKLLLESLCFPALAVVPDVVTSEALTVRLAILVYLKVSVQRLNLGWKCYLQSGYCFLFLLTFNLGVQVCSIGR